MDYNTVLISKHEDDSKCEQNPTSIISWEGLISKHQFD